MMLCQVISEVEWRTGKDLLERVVAMLTRMIAPGDQVREDEAVYGYVYAYGYGGSEGNGRAPLRRLGVLAGRRECQNISTSS